MHNVVFTLFRNSLRFYQIQKQRAQLLLRWPCNVAYATSCWL